MLQLSLFGDAEIPPDPNPGFPDGFAYRPELITPVDEQALLVHVQELPFREFEFHGYTGKRRVVSFGWQYDFTERRLRKSSEIPEFLLSIRAVAAGFASLEPEALQHALITEYGPGAAIGWHRDKGVFSKVVGLSLHASCVFRLRRAEGEKWERRNMVLEPRSAYIMDGPARSVWEHSIPAVDELRYSITFRNLCED